MKKVLSALVIGTVATLGAASVQAHQIWFEQGKDRTVTLYYGEYDKNMLEVTPGGMDRFKALSGQWVTANGTQPLPMTLQRASFSVGDKPGKDDSLLAVDKKYPIFKVKDEGAVVDTYWTPATRWVSDFRARSPQLDLDIVPTGVVKGDVVQFQVFYMNEPLTNKPVTLSSASGWDNLGTTDGEGKVSFALPWKGTYVLGIEYRDRTSGERVNTDNATEKYAIKSFSSTLSFAQTTGVTPLPKAPSTLPASEIARLNKK
jgi:hypothetical protein